MKTKVAIACQGGGTQTAFTAGVLKSLFESGVHKKVDIVSLSGTSGGAVCATLVWVALQKQEDPPIGNLIKFWEANTANNAREEIFNSLATGQIRAINRGMLPKWQLAPSSFISQMLFNIATTGLRKDFWDFRTLLETYIDFDLLKQWGPIDNAPILVLGAANCLKGRFRKFSSYKETIRVEHIMASAAVPTIFPAVEIDGEAYWDGLFSDNPPVNELIQTDSVGKHIPDEIWVIKINPTGRDQIPDQSEDIIDRRNEMVGNESLIQDIKQIETINDFLLDDVFKATFRDKYHIKAPIGIPKLDSMAETKSYHIPLIEMSKHLQDTLDYASKLDRSASNVEELIHDGIIQGQKFLKQRFK